MRIRTETIVHYLREHSKKIIARKLADLPAGGPFGIGEAAEAIAVEQPVTA